MIEKMKAAVLYGPFDLRVESVEKPKPGVGEVLLKVKASGIRGTRREPVSEKKRMIPHRLLASLATGIAIALLASGRVDVECLISHRLSLDELPLGLELLESRRATKVIIEPQRQS